jgi:hypothetical protein
MGKGQKVKNQNVESQKEHQKFEKDQNVKSLFKVIRMSKVKICQRTRLSKV